MEKIIKKFGGDKYTYLIKHIIQTNSYFVLVKITKSPLIPEESGVYVYSKVINNLSVSVKFIFCIIEKVLSTYIHEVLKHFCTRYTTLRRQKVSNGTVEPSKFLV